MFKPKGESPPLDGVPLYTGRIPGFGVDYTIALLDGTLKMNHFPFHGRDFYSVENNLDQSIGVGEYLASTDLHLGTCLASRLGLAVIAIGSVALMGGSIASLASPPPPPARVNS